MVVLMAEPATASANRVAIPPYTSAFSALLRPRA
jgi:hypothetical protein